MVLRLATILLFSTVTAVAEVGQATTLGVLEDVPGVYEGQPSSRGIRVVFHKTGNEWAAFPGCRDKRCLASVVSQYPLEVMWTIAFDGRSLGQITGRTPSEFNFYAHIGLQKVTGTGPIPTVGTGSSEYGGFTGAPVYRPLVAISQPYFKDPEAWKVSPLPPNLVRILRKQFRLQFPKLCRLSKQDETKLEPYAYRADDVKLVKAYASNRGWLIVRMHLAKAIDCDDVEAGFEIDDPWFAITPQKSIRYLDSGMWLVDAGDYDGDGRSEVVFAIDRYNRSGYELFYDEFQKRSVFQFSYH